MTKKQAPWKIFIGAANSHYCVLLGLAAWLEYMIIYGRNEESDFVFAYRGSSDKCSINRKASDMTKSVLKDPEFEIILEEKKGTHSMRKFATDMAKKRGIHKDDLDLLFRWLLNRMQNNYASTFILSVDRIVAEALCKDGAVHYHLKEYSGLTDEWVCDKVCPNIITRKYGKVVGKVLGRAFLWSIFDTKQCNVLPDFMVNCIQYKFNKVEKQLLGCENPVAKVPVYVSDDTNGNLILEAIIEDIDKVIVENKTEEQKYTCIHKQ